MYNIKYKSGHQEQVTVRMHNMEKTGRQVGKRQIIVKAGSLAGRWSTNTEYKTSAVYRFYVQNCQAVYHQSVNW